ncbi:LytR/AlgR family response regulator transcription factor [Tenacibaculum finnmarkense]|uniref:LytR/AlgR family response regulator transcription factor n=1 Tax=Tenacibaculum finnmarkense TaxID=2781243 RepID=UPI001EFB3386|nr:response regulator transcription factor [Tenacibaculum finnmarkense]MCG8207289.1 response regulator transcription factor [Tenacibaculum finnmarkense genomovar finnmarkense]MCG8723460.1 response regulator transcription factor [Tenacibaculum finnmarkense]MCG8741877.1 response regulator transcription factor [Tenacibaculum finnmarkense]MCG8765124.1 response regulator transcription factor [Tenacibaculum finnmarkense]MCG8777977.1 response regulator transcription factor [Tenacibaculum finnmarkense
MTDKKILIVEDELIIAENLRFILNEYGYEHITVSNDDTETFELFEKTTYDLVLMDINLGEMSTIDGIDLIKKLRQKYSFVFMYVTANADALTVKKASSTNPVGYILKPFINASIYANVAMALSFIKEEKNDNNQAKAAFVLHTEKGISQKIPISKITYIKADGVYIHIHTLDKNKYFTRQSLLELKELHPDFFIRIHKSILINKKHIQGYTSQIITINDQKLPLGRAYKQDFLKQIS